MTQLPDRRAQRVAPPYREVWEPLSPQPIHLCQVCFRAVARYPRAKSHTFRLPFGKTWTVEYVTPMVCMTCRVERQPEAAIAQGERRRFWKRFFALWLGERYPSAGPLMTRLIDLRIKLWGVHPHG